MKNIIWVIALFIIAGAVLLEFRYTVVVNSPIVVKLDRLSGDIWIVNSGYWRKVQTLKENGNTAADTTASKKQTSESNAAPRSK